MTVPAPSSLLANFGWLLADRGWRMVLGLVVSLVVARYLGPADLGWLSFATSLCAIFGTIAGLGIDDVLARELARHPASAAALVRRGLRLKLAGAAGAYVAVLLLGWLWPTGDGMTLVLLAWVAAGFFFAPADVVDLWYQARERMKPPVLVRQAVLVIVAAVRLGLVAAGAPLWCFAAAVALETGLTALGLGMLWRHGGLRPAPATGAVRTLSTRQLIGEGAPLLCSGLLVVVTMHCDRLLLMQLAGETAAGVYAAAARLTEMMHILPVALGAAFLPRFAKLHASDPAGYLRAARQAGLLVTGLTVGLAATFSLVAPWLIPALLGEAYRPSAHVWQVQVWSLVFVAIVSIRSRLWVVEGKTTWILAISAVTAVANVGGNWWLIPTHGAIGAAWAAVAAWGLSALVLPWLALGPARFMRRWCGLANPPEV
ncbi:MAG: flippase [Opitutaceae bacterium]|nr:flippase [Opitutaceae bacterium]